MSGLPISAILLSVLIHTLWGGNIVAGKIGLEVFPPFTSAGIRFVFGVATVLGWCLFRGIRLWPEPGEWRPLLYMATLFTLQIALMNLGIDNTSGSSAAILISTNPLFAAVFAHFLIGSDRLDVFRAAGLLVAFAGVVLTLYFSNTLSVTDAASGSVVASASQAGFTGTVIQKITSFGNVGDWICLASAAVLGYRLIASAIVMQDMDSYRMAFWPMFFSMPVFFMLGGTFESVEWAGFQWSALLALVYQGVVVAGICFMILNWLLSHYRPSLMASFNFIAPVSGVLLSILLLGESFSSAIAISVFLVAVGMILLTLKSKSVV